MSAVESIDLGDLLDRCDSVVRDEFESMPSVEDIADFDPHDPSGVPIEARKWLRIEDVVAVVADLKSSTQLSVNKYAASTASIYQAALRPVVDTFVEFGASYVTLQGDCVIGLFWDERAVERAMCAGITAKTFSKKHFVTRLEKKWPDDGLDTGFKLGVGMSTLLVKRVGRPRSPHYGLVWPGKAVNHATKAAQDADAHELIVTGSVWDEIENIDYLTFSCTCSEPSDSIWTDHEISRLRDGEPDRTGRKLASMWCDVHGEEYCNAILAGLRNRDEIAAKRAEARKEWLASNLAQVNRQRRENRRHLRRARTGR